MSKRIVKVKTIVDYLLQHKYNEFEASRLIKEFNKNSKNKYKLKEISEANKECFANMKVWLKKQH